MNEMVSKVVFFLEQLKNTNNNGIIVISIINRENVVQLTIFYQ